MAMPPPDPPTTCQLPKTAAEYYSKSVPPRGGLFEYVLLGEDLCGRSVYQKLLDGKEYGEPRALLTYQEYVRKVKLWGMVRSMGVQRWCVPTLP